MLIFIKFALRLPDWVYLFDVYANAISLWLSFSFATKYYDFVFSPCTDLYRSCCLKICYCCCLSWNPDKKANPVKIEDIEISQTRPKDGMNAPNQSSANSANSISPVTISDTSPISTIGINIDDEQPRFIEVPSESVDTGSCINITNRQVSS